MRQQVNLYQPELRPQRVPLPARQAVLLLGGVVLALAAAQAWTYATLVPVRAQVAELERQLAAAEARVETVRAQYPPPRPDAGLARTLERSRAALTQTRQIAARLRTGAYGTVDGLSGYLAGLARQHVEGTWLTAVRIVAGGRAVGLEGKTLAPELVPAYLERLSGEPLFRGKTFEALELEAVGGGLDEVAFRVRTAGIGVPEAP